MLVRFIAFALAAMLPPAGALPGVADCGLRDFVRRYWRETVPDHKGALVIASLIFHFGPLFTIWIPLPAVLLPKGLLDRHADAMATHPLYFFRQMANILKMAAGACWGADDAVRRALGVEPLEGDPGTFREGARP